ncbi:hypothetical protein Purlil1_4793 [Purpureocillium lilacinum]|uniref:Uncharacterized protein n=1 Tax=Purpureocillium lilacinum TaxID=33203 RepID=A0ABR0C383_PURLI|nr:hypothetical protein Purlil1_4793 [Purpureocillium lilacinum]
MGGRLGGIDSTRKGSRQGGEDAHGRFVETQKAVVHPSTALVVVFALRGCWGQCVIGAVAAPRRTPQAIGSLATVGVAAWRQLEVPARHWPPVVASERDLPVDSGRDEAVLAPGGGSSQPVEVRPSKRRLPGVHAGGESLLLLLGRKVDLAAAQHPPARTRETQFQAICQQHRLLPDTLLSARDRSKQAKKLSKARGPPHASQRHRPDAKHPNQETSRV